MIKSITSDVEWCNLYFRTNLWTSIEVRKTITDLSDQLKMREVEIAELHQQIEDLELQIECTREDDGWRWNE